MEKIFDLAVIGAGINGAGIAADAALRGLSVILIEKDDLASKTSSSSSKLIHGGLRYLEHYDFCLVKKALNERRKLFHLAAHLVRPLPFVIPYSQSMRPAWFLRTGLFIYDLLAFKNPLPKSQSIKRALHQDYFMPLSSAYEKGFLYYDCTADDARLTLANVSQAVSHGAVLSLHSEFMEASVEASRWKLRVKNKAQGEFYIQSKTVINVTGPWVNQINQRLGHTGDFDLALVKGSHLIVKKLYEGNHAYLLQNTDNRIVFVIPWLNHSLIGTTEVPYSGSLDAVTIDQDEIAYLLKAVNHYFAKPLGKESIISTYSGVRPLLAEGQKLPEAISRDYSYELHQSPAPYLSVYGGKITTYRQLAREAVDCLSPFFKNPGQSRTDKIPLPGSNPESGQSFQQFCLDAKTRYAWLKPAILERYLDNYGTETSILLRHCRSIADLGFCFGHDLYQREVDYLLQKEWVSELDDLLWRRTRFGLVLDQAQTEKLKDYVKNAMSLDEAQSR